MLYRASKHDCAGCALKLKCCPRTPARKVPRSIYEGARDMARQIAKSREGGTSRRLRKKVEMLFAHLKTLRADADAATDDQHADHQFGIDRRAARRTVERREVAAQLRQINKAIDRPQ